MSAIGGLVLFDDDGDALRLGASMSNQLQIYNYDAFEVAAEENVYFSCGLIYSTPESMLEQLPRKSGSERYVLTADAIIDNRAELFQLLSIDEVKVKQIADSELILLAYEKWGYECTKYLIGDYAFAIWDKERQELYCARDAMGPRSFYYTYSSNRFAFCTLEKPLLGITGKIARINEQWIAEFLAIDGIQHELDARQTAYEGIYQLLPAHYMIINATEQRQVQYWDPIKDIKPIRYTTDEQYVEAFNHIFYEAVSCRLRSAGETSIMLSGGMDSGSIACVAAKLLEQTNKKLYAFSSIPVQDFDEEANDNRTVYNESNEINYIKNSYPNIDVTYCSFEDNNSYSNIDTALQVLETPYKVYRNVTWYLPMLKQASTNNCKIMLNGQVGNSTISYGDFQVQLLTLVRSWKLVSAFKEIHALSRHLKVPVKRVYKYSAKVAMPYKIRAWRAKKQHRDYDRFENVLVNESLIDKYNLNERLDEFRANMLVLKYSDYDEERALRANHNALTHIAALETKLSLANRITIRDPARDRRVVEFCLNIPPDQYVRNGQDRYLLRRAMKGILPDQIRMNVRTKGLQSADWLHRLKPIWDQVLKELEHVIVFGDIEPYVNMNKLKHIRSELAHGIDKKNEHMVGTVLAAIIVHRFVFDFNSAYGVSNE